MNIAQEIQEATANSFALLKRNAHGPADIKDWFKNNLHIVPKLPAELREFVIVDINFSFEQFDYVRNTIDTSFRIEFSVKHQEDKSACDLFEQITGVGIVEDQPSKTYMQSRFEITLDALEWHFIAIEKLRSLTPEQLEKPSRKPVYRNILETHFPHLKWRTFMDLYNTDLLPKDADAFAQVLKGTSPDASSAVIPDDMSL